MTIHPYSPYISVAFSSLAIALSGWNFWRMKYAYRKRGRREVERMLASRGESLIGLKELPFTAVPVKTGLNSIVVFEVRARTAEGDERTHQWAYEPRVFPWQTEGLKRLAHGIWIPA